MTIHEIRTIARNHGVPEIVLYALPKSLLHRRVSTYYDGLVGYCLLSGDEAKRAEYVAKREALLGALAEKRGGSL